MANITPVFSKEDPLDNQIQTGKYSVTAFKSL